MILFQDAFTISTLDVYIANHYWLAPVAAFLFVERKLAALDIVI